jgi:hypothetical protein
MSRRPAEISPSSEAVGYARDLKRRLSATPATPSVVCRRRQGPQASSVGYAIDPNRELSATPATPIGAVDGVGGRLTILSVA